VRSGGTAGADCRDILNLCAVPGRSCYFANLSKVTVDGCVEGSLFFRPSDRHLKIGLRRGGEKVFSLLKGWGFSLGQQWKTQQTLSV
jgi:hypothetical protein